MGNTQSKGMQTVTIIISLLALCISSASLYYVISDHTEELVYELRNCQLIITFHEVQMRDNQKSFYPIIYLSNDIYLYNNSNFTVTLKNIEKYYENEEGRILIEEINPLEFFDSAILKPGDYVARVVSDFGVVEETEIKNKYQTEISNKIKEFLANNQEKISDHESKDGYYSVDGLNDYILPLINKITSDKKYERIIYKVTTSRGKSIWIRFNYLDDINDSAN